MGVKIRDIVGLRTEKLLVLSFASGVGQQSLWNCICDCGAEKLVRYKYLVDKQKPVRSCGCLGEAARQAYRKKTSTEGKTHGGSKHEFFPSWSSMMQRCTNPNDLGYNKYGAVGRNVCPRWSDPISGFWCFVEDMGDRPNDTYTLDRIDNNLGYFPENCRWVDKSTQVFNRNYKVRPGVRRSNNGERWRAVISYQYNHYDLGTYDTYEEAVFAREQAEIKYYGEVWTGQALEVLQ